MAANAATPQTITPVFYMLDVEDVPASRAAGFKVTKPLEMVDIRIPGNRHYNPHEPAHAFWKQENGEDITNAMRWSEEYKHFKEKGFNGSPRGTPISNLTALNKTQLSTLKGLSILTVEILASLEGKNLSNIGIGANEMKREAQKYLEAMRKTVTADDVTQKIAELQLQNEALIKRLMEGEAQKSAAPVEVSEEDQNDPYFGLTDDDLKDKIKLLAGEKPKGQPRRETLINMLVELEAQAE